MPGVKEFQILCFIFLSGFCIFELLSGYVYAGKAQWLLVGNVCQVPCEGQSWLRRLHTTLCLSLAVIFCIRAFACYLWHTHVEEVVTPFSHSCSALVFSSSRAECPSTQQAVLSAGARVRPLCPCLAFPHPHPTSQLIWGPADRARHIPIVWTSCFSWFGFTR